MNRTTCGWAPHAAIERCVLQANQETAADSAGIYRSIHPCCWSETESVKVSAAAPRLRSVAAPAFIGAFVAGET